MTERLPRRGAPPPSPLVEARAFAASVLASVRAHRAWLAAIGVLLAAMLAAHAPSLPSTWRGDTMYAYSGEDCNGPLANAAAPSPEGTAVNEGCDVILTQRMAWGGWRRLKLAWKERSSVGHFLFADVWQVAIDSRTFVILDLILFVWAPRLLFWTAPALVVLHLLMIALAAIGGVGFARALRVSPLAGLAAGLAAGTSGVVLESVMRGQYPQAALPATLALFAGLYRLARGERFGVALTVAGAAISSMLYWQAVVVLGVGAAVFGGAMRLSGPFAPGTWKRLAWVVLITTLICLPPVWPVVRVLSAGTEGKFAVVPWGTPFPDITSDPAGMPDMFDEVPWFDLLSWRDGWTPILPLLPAALAGLWGRRRAAWWGIAVFGGLMALGPVPTVPWSGHVIEGYSTLPRAPNWLYQTVYQWVPTASRMCHPMRWGMLYATAGVAAVAFGVDRIEARAPKLARGLVAAGVAFAVLVGPWPLHQNPFPRETVKAFDGCTDIIIAGQPPDSVDVNLGPDDGAQVHDDMHRLEGMLWVERTPIDAFAGRGPVGTPTLSMTLNAQIRTDELNAALLGDEHARAALKGACVIFEPHWAGGAYQDMDPRLEAAFGPPTAAFTSRYLFHYAKYPRELKIYRP